MNGLAEILDTSSLETDTPVAVVIINEAYLKRYAELEGHCDAEQLADDLRDMLGFDDDDVGVGLVILRRDRSMSA